MIGIDLLRSAIRAASGNLADEKPSLDFAQEVRDAYMGTFDAEVKEGQELEAAADLARDLVNLGLAIRRQRGQTL